MNREAIRALKQEAGDLRRQLKTVEGVLAKLGGAPKRRRRRKAGGNAAAIKEAAAKAAKPVRKEPAKARKRREIAEARQRRMEAEKKAAPASE